MPAAKPILFGGAGALPARQAQFRKPKPGERPAWVEAFEEAFVKLTLGDRYQGEPGA